MAELASSLVATDDDRLLQAEAMVRRYCGWHIAPEQDAEWTLDAPAGPHLVLPTLHLTNVESITLDGTLLAGRTPTEVGDYSWSESGIVTASASHWWGCNYRSIVVKATHGYEEPPPDVTAAVQMLAQRLQENPGGLQQITVGPFSEQYGSEALGSTGATLLAPYRLPWRA